MGHGLILLILMYKIDRLDVVLFEICVWRETSDALKITSEETLALEMVFLTDFLDVILVVIKRLLDGINDVLVNGLRRSHPGIFIDDGRQIFGCDM